MRVHLDFETRSRVDLKKVGAWAYAMHPSTEVMCLSYSIDGAAPVTLTAYHLARPAGQHTALEDAARDPRNTFVAHNAQFEFAIWECIMVPLGWPALDDPARWDCTLARAAMCNLPISLDACGAALGISAVKDLTGRAAMLKLCKPLPDGTFSEDPELYKILYEYCAKDVLAEMEIDSRLPAMPQSEKDIWNLDLIINRRGVRMDLELARAAESMVGGLTDELNARLVEITGGAVTKASRVAEIKRYLETQGVFAPSLNKESVNTLLADPKISQNVKDVLNIRRQVGKTSTSKYTAILSVASSGDERARGLMQYHGASTGRWAGRLIQPHNFPKGVDALEQELIISAILADNRGELSRMFGDEAMDALSGALRGTIVAGGRKVLVVADYSTIEPRVLFWLADDEEALAAYRSGADLYVDLARIVFKNPALTKKDAFERAVGKFGVLGCGYGMGAPRFQAQCATNGVDITLDLAAQAVRAYRDRYIKVVQMWRSVEAAAKKAIREPGAVVPCCGGRVHFGMDKKREFLICRLPSGRMLRYYRPSIKSGEYGEEVHYQGPGLGGFLEDQKTYGGSLVENIVQAVARDILAAAMLRTEIAGFDTVFHVHDEIVAEWDLYGVAGDEIERGVEDFIKIMCEVPTWAAGCPIKAEGWMGARYRK